MPSHFAIQVLSGIFFPILIPLTNNSVLPQLLNTVMSFIALDNLLLRFPAI